MPSEQERSEPMEGTNLRKTRSRSVASNQGRAVRLPVPPLKRPSNAASFAESPSAARAESKKTPTFTNPTFIPANVNQINGGKRKRDDTESESDKADPGLPTIEEEEEEDEEVDHDDEDTSINTRKKQKVSLTVTSKGPTGATRHQTARDLKLMKLKHISAQEEARVAVGPSITTQYSSVASTSLAVTASELQVYAGAATHDQQEAPTVRENTDNQTVRSSSLFDESFLLRYGRRPTPSERHLGGIRQSHNRLGQSLADPANRVPEDERIGTAGAFPSIVGGVLRRQNRATAIRSRPRDRFRPLLPRSVSMRGDRSPGHHIPRGQRQPVRPGWLRLSRDDDGICSHPLTCTFFWDHTITIRIDLNFDLLNDRAININQRTVWRAVRDLIMEVLTRDGYDLAISRVHKLDDLRIVWPYHGGWNTPIGQHGIRRETILGNHKRMLGVLELAVLNSPHSYLEFKAKDDEGREVLSIYRRPDDQSDIPEEDPNENGSERGDENEEEGEIEDENGDEIEHENGHRIEPGNGHGTEDEDEIKGENEDGAGEVPTNTNVTDPRVTHDTHETASVASSGLSEARSSPLPPSSPKHDSPKPDSPKPDSPKPDSPKEESLEEEDQPSEHEQHGEVHRSGRHGSWIEGSVETQEEVYRRLAGGTKLPPRVPKRERDTKSEVPEGNTKEQKKPPRATRSEAPEGNKKDKRKRKHNSESEAPEESARERKKAKKRHN